MPTAQSICAVIKKSLLLSKIITKTHNKQPMPANKNALIRYKTIDNCLRRRHRQWTLNDLVEAGYINRHEYFEGKVKCVEYTTNYYELLERAAQGEHISLKPTKKAKKAAKNQGGLKMRPATECAAEGGSQNETGLKMIQKGSQNDTKGGLKMVPNNIIDNIRYYFSSRTREEQEEEKKEFFKIFFFRNAADPAAEVERFVAYNESRG